MTVRVRVDRHRCIGAGNCITIAPTAFDWHAGDFLKADVVDADSVDEEVLHEARLACPTLAIEIEQVQELLPWQLRTAIASTPRRVLKTFMFTDIVNSTQLVEAIGDEAWGVLLRWHDETLRSLVASYNGEVIDTAGDGFFVGFDSPEAAVACAVAIQRRLAENRKASGFAPQLRIGVHASEATQTSGAFSGKGVHEAARISALAGAGEILASTNTVAGGKYPTGEPREATLKGIANPVEIVSVDWR
ncbi:MAG: ferredoxin [Chloroflexota bacterium]|nr:ferredoxin [Chloroflexota bacterium]